MAARFFETTFRLTAIFTGAAAFNAMADKMKGLDKGAKGATVSFQKLAGAAIGVAAGLISIQKVSAYLNEAKANAIAGQKAFDKLGLSLARVKPMQKLELMEPGTIERNQKALFELAGTMEKTGGIAQNTLAAGMATLSRSFAPKKINDMSAGMQDFIVKTKGLRATADDAQDVFMKITQAIENASTTGLVKSRILTGQQEDQYKKLVKAGANHAKRAEFFQKIIGQATGETARQFQTLDGILYNNELAWGRVSQSIGTVQMAMEKKLTPIMTKMANKLEPVMERLSKKLIEGIEKIDFAAVEKALDQFGNALIGAFEWLEEHWDVVEVALVGIAAAVVGLTGALVAFVAVSLAPWIPIAAGIALVSFAIGMLVVHWDKIAPHAEAAWNALKVIWEPVGEWFFNFVVKPITRAWNDLLAAFRGEISWSEAFQTVGEEILTIFQGIGKGIVAALGAGIEAAGKVDWIKLLGDIFNFANDLTKQLDKVLGDAWNAIEWPKVLGDAGNFAIGVVKFISEGISGIWSKIVWPKVDWGAIFGTVSMPDIKLPDFSSLKFPPAPDWLTKLFTFKMPKFPWDKGDKPVEVVELPDPSLVKTIEEALGRVNIVVKEVAATFQAWVLPPSLLSGMDQLVTKAGDVKRAVSEASMGASAISIPGMQVGGLVANPTIAALAEKGTPEMVIPMKSGARSEGLMSQAASILGLKGKGGGGGPINVSVSPTINIGSVASGQEKAVAREVEAAIENPIRTLLEELRKAKAEEQRLSYA